LRTLAATAAAGVAMLSLAACGGSGHHTSTGTSSTTAAQTTTTANNATTATTQATTATTQATGQSTSTTAGGSTSTTLATAQNEVATAAIKEQLLAAGAAYHSLPVSDYTGLEPGETFYAYDPATQTYWAGAGLDPSPNSQQAQISNQDDGAYLLFHMAAGGTWTVVNVGLAGTEGSTCPYTPPAAILALWGWPPSSCRPATID
jgi:hypothetical protein